MWKPPAIQGLHAQATPPVYYVSIIDVTNPDAYGKEYAPKEGKKLVGSDAVGSARQGMSVALSADGHTAGRLLWSSALWRVPACRFTWRVGALMRFAQDCCDL
jgi:hypothetical protein